MKKILTYLRVIWEFSPSQTLLFIFLLVLSTFTQGIGLILLIPLLSVLQDGGAIASGVGAHVVKALGILGIPINLTGVLAAFLVVTGVSALLKYAQTVIADSFRLEFLDDLRTKSFDAVLATKWQWIANSKRSDISNLLITEINQVGVGLFFAIRFLITIFSIFIYTFVALTLSPKMTLIAVVFGVVLMIAMRGQYKRSQVQGRMMSDANQDVQLVIEEGLAGLKLTKILGNEARHSQLMKDIRTRVRERTLDFTKLNAATGLIFQIFVAFGIAIFLFLGAQIFNLNISTLLILIVIFLSLIHI